MDYDEKTIARVQEAVSPKNELLLVAPCRSLLVVINRDTETPLSQLSFTIDGKEYHSDKCGNLVNWLIDDGPPAVRIELLDGLYTKLQYHYYYFYTKQKKLI